MSTTDTPLIVRTVGELNQDTLTALRDRLGLRRRGRLGDQEDELFGERLLTDDVNGGRLDLWRTHDGWWFKLTHRGVAPTPQTIAQIERDVTAAAHDAGLTITTIGHY